MSITNIIVALRKIPPISSDDINDNISKMSNLRWSDFMVPIFKEAVEATKKEVQFITSLLQRHLDSLDNKSSTMRLVRSTPAAERKKKDRGTVAAFEKSLHSFPIDDNEFIVEIDWQKQKKRAGGRVSAFGACVATSVENVFSKLRHTGDYCPLFLTDELIGIDKFAKASGKGIIRATDRAKWRLQFRQELSYGIQSMMIYVYGKRHPSTNDPDSLFVWKVPTVHDAQHAGKVAKVIGQCKEMAPKKMSAEAIKHADSILKGITNISADARTAVRNFLFLGDPDPDDKLADDYVDFVLQLASGKPIEESMLRHDRRHSNSRGGKGTSATMYQVFWDCCKEVLLPDARVEERRHSNTMHASAAHSIPNLVKQVTELLEGRVARGKLQEMPPIPSIEWVRLQFIPNNAFSNMAAKFTGNLGVKRGVQSRTLRKQHIDQHWVNAFVRYHLEWLVELKSSGFRDVEFFGQDDKAKIPIGDEVSLSNLESFTLLPYPPSLNKLFPRFMFPQVFGLTIKALSKPVIIIY